MTLQQLADKFSVLAVRSVDIEGPVSIEGKPHDE